MSLEGQSLFLITAILVSIRLGALFLMTPIFSIADVPVKIRVLFVLAMSVTLTSVLDMPQYLSPVSIGNLFYAAATELFIGMLLAFGLFAAFAAFMFGGRILDFQMGFSVANLIDPSTNAQSPMLGVMLSLMAVMTFFLLDGHHLLIRGLAYSFEKIPPGSGLIEMNIEAVVAQFGLMFVFGIALVAPAVITLLLIDVSMAVMARTMPQVNIFIIGLPLKIFVGLSITALSMPFLAPLLHKIYKSIFVYWQEVIG